MKIIDTDIHHGWPQPDSLRKRLPRYFQEAHFAFPGFDYSSPVGVLRADAAGPNGEQAGSSLEQLRIQHLEPNQVVAGIMTADIGLSAGIHPHVDYSQAYARAYAEALLENWLEPDERLFGALLVCPQDPARAAKHIREFGAHPKFVSIVMASATRVPLGQRYYWPIYEAACELQLPVSVHPGTEARGTANGFIAGPPSTYFEWHTNLPQNYMGQIVSLLSEGVFQEFPSMRFVAIEGGLAWIPGVLWRLDKNWKALRSQIPWLAELPSETLLRHVRFTSQPLEEPASSNHLKYLMEMIDAKNTLMFSSDYPHWDNDAPGAILRGFPEEFRRQVFYANALETYPKLKSLPNEPASHA